MKYYLQAFAFTFFMYFGLWIMWIHFAIDFGSDRDYPGSIVYLPHAARVICTCLFGWIAIPAMVFAEWIGISYFIHGDAFLVNGTYSLAELTQSIFASSSVLLALILLRVSGFSFSYSAGMLLLKKSNFRHIFLITVISASINGLFGNFLRQAITDHDIHMYTVLRFTVGDIMGCITVLLVSTIMLSAYKDFIYQSSKK